MPHGKAQMWIIAFVQQPNSIKEIMNSLGLPEYRGPAALKFKTRSVFDEQLCIDEIPDYDL